MFEPVRWMARDLASYVFPKEKQMSRLIQRMTIATLILGVAGIAAAFGDKAPAKAESKCPALQARCPVGGEKVDMKVSIVDKKYGKVYFCCEKCVKTFEADPAKYADKVHVQQIALAPHRVQVTCPVSGKPVDKKHFAEHHGEKIYFCCDKCKPAFEKDLAKYEDMLGKCYTTQTKCPISDEDIDPAVSTKTKDGRTVYFCCAKCEKKFTEDPEQWLKKLDEMAAKGHDAAGKLMDKLPGGKK